MRHPRVVAARHFRPDLAGWRKSDQGRAAWMAVSPLCRMGRGLAWVVPLFFCMAGQGRSGAFGNVTAVH